MIEHGISETLEQDKSTLLEISKYNNTSLQMPYFAMKALFLAVLSDFWVLNAQFKSNAIREIILNQIIKSAVSL